LAVSVKEFPSFYYKKELTNMDTRILYKNDSVKDILNKINDLISIHGMEIVETNTYNITMEKNQTIVTLKEKDMLWELTQKGNINGF